jgi:hypothetical protein
VGGIEALNQLPKVTCARVDVLLIATAIAARDAAAYLNFSFILGLLLGVG